MSESQMWTRYQEWLCECLAGRLRIDVSRMDFGDDFIASMQPIVGSAFQAMKELEQGAIANPDEQRMVGHYWLRQPDLAPSGEISEQLRQTIADIKAFAQAVHSGEIKPLGANRFDSLLLIGIGGSALGPQLVHDALRSGTDKMQLQFLDNTDPDGFDRTFQDLGERLASTLVLVVSKSGGTKETRNGMLEAEQAFKRHGLDFSKHAVAVTGKNSNLDQHATKNGWLKQFPMWDWVGGRTSVLSAVGLLPAALQGLAIQTLLDGAAAMDTATRTSDPKTNPAALLALMWHHATGGRGLKDMVILPYKDRLLLISRYLQQLVMESLGKELDLDGKPVHQGIAVYGNKGSTDQHAYVQQLRDGIDNFFVTFIVVLQDRDASSAGLSVEVEPGVTSGDYLNGFWLGTRQALHEKGRQSITITIDKLDAWTLGALIALYERAVGLYATMVNINAYPQPGVEAGKKAADAVLALRSLVATQQKSGMKEAGAEQIAQAVQRELGQKIEQEASLPEDQQKTKVLAEQLNNMGLVETIHHILEHLAANSR